MLYAATTRAAAFVEVLQDFRKIAKPLSVGAAQRLAQIEQDTDDIPRVDAKRVPTGVVPMSHLRKLCIGDLTVESSHFADIEHVSSVQFVRLPLLGEARRHGLGDVNLGSILSNVRAFTQALSAWLYFDFRDRPLGGVRYGSTLGRPYENWAVFETVGLAMTAPRATISGGDSSWVHQDDPDLRTALRDLGVRIA